MRQRTERGGSWWRPLLAASVACYGAVAGYAAARAQGPAPVTPKPARPPDVRVWKMLEDAARNLPARGGAGARAVAVAEVSYPRSAAEAKTLRGQSLLLVSTLAEKIGDAAVERVTLHFENGRKGEPVLVTEQLNDLDDEQSPAVKAVGRYRKDSLFFIPLPTTGTKAYVTATYAGRTEVVMRFPRAPTAYPSSFPVIEPDTPRLEDVGVIGRALYPFFRTPPLRSPGAETTCTLHEPPPPPRADERGPGQMKGRLMPADDKGKGKDKDKDKDKSPGTTPVRGALGKEVVQEVVRAHTAEVQSCWDRTPWGNINQSARVEVNFTIGAEGWVTSSVLQSSTVNNKRLNDCIVATVRCWRFPKPTGGGIVVINYPWLLTPTPGSKAD